MYITSERLSPKPQALSILPTLPARSMDYDRCRQHSPSFKRKIKSSCCFLNHNQISSRMEYEHPAENSPTDRPHRESWHLSKNSPSSPSSWIKSRAHDFVSEEIKEKWLHLFGRIGRHGGRRGNRYRDSSEFRYDPLSYALNFDDSDDTRVDEYPHFRGFSARLPRSPPRKADMLDYYPTLGLYANDTNWTLS